MALDSTLVEDIQKAAPVDEWPEEKDPGALKTLWQHRELLMSLVRRDIRSRYKQSILGIAWALIQPLALTIVSTIVMSYIAKVPTDGIPYPIFHKGIFCIDYKFN